MNALFVTGFCAAVGLNLRSAFGCIADIVPSSDTLSTIGQASPDKPPPLHAIPVKQYPTAAASPVCLNILHLANSTLARLQIILLKPFVK